VGAALWQKDRIVASPIFEVRHIEVSGLTSAPRGEFLAWLGLGEGMSFLSLPRDNLADVSDHFPRIRDITWSYRPFGTLRVRVDERHPVALLVTATQEAWEMAYDGVAWATEGSVPDMPLLVHEAGGTVKIGPSGRGVQVSGLDSVLRWLGHVQALYPNVWAELSQLRQMGPGLWRCTLCSSRRVLVVPEDVSFEHWDAVETILADLDRREHEDAVLDMRFDDRVVVRLPS
jgi:hypothetical protein